jgi:hypothetical protein
VDVSRKAVDPRVHAYIPLCPSFFFLLLGLVEVDFVLTIDAYLGIYTAKKP